MIILAPLLLIILAGAFALGLTLLIENTLHRKDIVLDDIVFFIEGNGVRAARIDLIKYNKYHTMYRAVPNAGKKLSFSQRTSEIRYSAQNAKQKNTSNDDLFPR